MSNFEKIGRTIDREFARLKSFLENEVKPTTERRIIEALRKTSEHLVRMAEQMEGRRTKRAAPRRAR
jgi:hypothetical protein